MKKTISLLVLIFVIGCAAPRTTIRTVAPNPSAAIVTDSIVTFTDGNGNTFHYPASTPSRTITDFNGNVITYDSTIPAPQINWKGDDGSGIPFGPRVVRDTVTDRYPRVTIDTMAYDSTWETGRFRGLRAH